FRRIGNLPVPADRLENGADRGGLHQRGGAAAEKDRFDQPPRRAARGGLDFLHIGGNEALLVEFAVMDVGIEVAIGAFGRAERPMDIDTKMRVGAQRTSFTNFAKARARCDNPSLPGAQECFSAALIWPNVFSYPSGLNIGS